MDSTTVRNADQEIRDFSQKHGAGGRMLIAGMAAVHAEKPEDRARAVRYCDTMDRLMNTLSRAANEEAYSRHRKHPRYDLQRTTITVHPHLGAADNGKRREISVELARGVALSHEDCARLRDALRVVASIVLGAPKPGQRTEVYVHDVVDGIPALEHALGCDETAEAIWAEMVADAQRRIEERVRPAHVERSRAPAPAGAGPRPRRHTTTTAKRAVA